MNEDLVANVTNTAIVVLGATGDLAKRKLVPALIELYNLGKIEPSTVIIGEGRHELSNEDFRSKFQLPQEITGKFYYHQGIKGLKQYIEEMKSVNNIVFFLALPPNVYGDTVRQLSEEGFKENCRIIIEKPFGFDYESACKLGATIHNYFDEEQIFRIDHYLAKEAVQNILIFRFANFLFSQIWSNNYIDSIQINAFEQIGIENRAAYFDKSGIIRDMIQNHLFQLLSLLTMEAPVDISPEEIKHQKLNVLKSIRVKKCVKYQYKGYLNEPGVAKDSTTPTYAELKLAIDNFRWSGVNIFIRTGKALDRKGTEIGVVFKKLPRILYNKNDEMEPNKIIIKIQPEAGIIIDLETKIPGGDVKITTTNLAFCYKDSFQSEVSEAYQKLLLDALKGDKTLFVSEDEVEAAWEKLDPIIKDTKELKYYEKGVTPPSKFCNDWINFAAYEPKCKA